MELISKTLEHIILNGYFPQIPTFRAQGTPWKRRRREHKSQKGWEVPAEQDPLNQLKRAHLNSKRMKKQTQGMRGSISDPLHIYYSCPFSIFIGLLSVWMCGSLILVSSLGCFSFHWFAFSNFDVILKKFTIKKLKKKFTLCSLCLCGNIQ